MGYDSDFAFRAIDGVTFGQSADEYAYYSSKIRFYTDIAESLISLVSVPMDGAFSMIDFGCGDGLLAKLFLERFTRPLAGDARQTISIYLVDKYQSMLDLTASISHPCAVVHRICAAEDLGPLPETARGRVDLVAANSSLHLCADPEVFVGRSNTVLRPRGCVLANIPDQAWEFEDGWRSVVAQKADELLPPSPRSGTRPAMNMAVIEQWGAQFRMRVEVSWREFELSWQDFVNLYSIPFIGARRLRGMSQAQRVAYLNSLCPAFSVIPYRWVFVRMTK